MSVSGNGVDKTPYEKNPIILYESHADPITVDFIRTHLDDLIQAGYTAICLEQPDVNLERSIAELTSRLPLCDAVVEDIESGAHTYISEHLRGMYKEHASAFEKQFKIGLEHKILLYQTILDYQKEHDGLPKIYGIDSGIESPADMAELAEIYRSEDFDNPNFNRVRDTAFAHNLQTLFRQHEGGVITIMGADHFGLQKMLSEVLSEEQTKQIKSLYHFALTGPQLGSSSHSRGLREGRDESTKRFVLGIDVRDYSHKERLAPSDFAEILSHLMAKTSRETKKSPRP